MKKLCELKDDEKVIVKYKEGLRKHLFGQICRKCAGRKLEVWKC